MVTRGLLTVCLSLLFISGFFSFIFPSPSTFLPLHISFFLYPSFPLLPSLSPTLTLFFVLRHILFAPLNYVLKDEYIEWTADHPCWLLIRLLLPKDRERINKTKKKFLLMLLLILFFDFFLLKFFLLYSLKRFLFAFTFVLHLFNVNN